MSVQQTIEQKLQQAFSLQHLDVVNESHQHNVPANSETHFKVTMVSPDFAGQGLVVRHQSAYKVLNAELNAGVHALALHMFTEQEWQKKNGVAPLSPPCISASYCNMNCHDNAHHNICAYLYGSTHRRGVYAYTDCIYNACNHGDYNSAWGTKSHNDDVCDDALSYNVSPRKRDDNYIESHDSPDKRRIDMSVLNGDRNHCS